MNRTVRSGIVAALLLVHFLAPASASADEDRLELSRDGVHWSDDLARPLFSPDVRWVPGDVRTSRFYIRNVSVDTGRLLVAVERTRPEQELVDRDAMVIDTRTDSGPWQVVGTDAGESQVELARVGTQTVVAVDVRARMRAGATNDTMRLGAQLAVKVTLIDADAVLDDGVSPSEGSGGPGSAGGPGGLPATGTDVPPWLPPSAFAMLGLGVYLLRRRRDDEALTSS